ncbi:MAG TPA: glycosyltransferase family 4 protein [Chloroflexia bacterium]|nr:glycosyltransferase family 4 protein [Chloroflexia bacterium]
MGKKIRILFFYPNEFLGPEMTVYAQEIRHLDRTRFQPYLVLNENAGGHLPFTEEDGIIIKQWKFGMSFRGGLAQALRTGVHLPASLLGLVRYARQAEIDIVQCSAVPRTAILGYLLARLSGARLLLHYHVIPGRYAGLRGWVERTVARRADRSVAVSEFLARKVVAGGIPADRVDVVVNGADCRRFTPDVDGSAIRAEYGIGPDEVLVLQMGRIIQQKRQEDVVKAFALARKEVPGLRCLLVGWEDPRYVGSFSGYKAELEHIAEAEGLGDSLIIAEARPEAPQLVAASDIVVMPSIEDAWNLAVTEAMAAGKPVVGSESGGIPEQIVEGATGFLVPLYDVDALAERLVRLGRDAELRQSLGRAARQRAESRFEETHLAADFAPIYERLVTGADGPSAGVISARPQTGFSRQTDSRTASE